MRSALCAQSKSQKSERMKKMMKKFLSSLLALTMILSLVIVPANATGGTDIGTGTGTGTGTSAATGSATLSITGATGKGGHAKVGDTLTFALTNPVVNDSSVKVISKNINPDSVTWKVDSAENNGSYEVTTADAGKTLTVTRLKLIIPRKMACIIKVPVLSASAAASLLPLMQQRLSLIP